MDTITRTPIVKCFSSTTNNLAIYKEKKTQE